MKLPTITKRRDPRSKNDSLLETTMRLKKSVACLISYIMNEVKPLENVNKNPQRFLEISSIQTELAPL